MESVPVPPRGLEKSSSVNLAETITQPPVTGTGVPTFVPPNSAMSSVKSWIIPEVQGTEENLTRDMVTLLAARHLASVSVLALNFSYFPCHFCF